MIFKDRIEAGKFLGAKLEKHRGKGGIVFTLPPLLLFPYLILLLGCNTFKDTFSKMVNLFDIEKQIKRYPALDIRGIVVFPSEKASLVLEGEEVKKVVERAHKNSDHLAVLLFKKDNKKSKVGVLAQINQHGEFAPSILGLNVEGVKRVIVLDEKEEDGIKAVEVEEVTIEKADNTEVEALSRSVFEQFKKLMKTEGLVSTVIIEELDKEHFSPEKVSNFISANLKVDFLEKLDLLETLDLKEQLEKLSKRLVNEVNIAQAEQRIQDQVEKEVSQTQKEYVLKERLKAIEKELGISEEQKEYEGLERKILQLGMPDYAKNKALGELKRLRQMPQASAEAPYIRTYLEWLADLPWNRKSQNNFNLGTAREILDEEHFGLEKVKERVLEYLAVQKLTGGKGRGNILCFTGPPGTGKTSVGQAIAKALGRNFVRISLGGIRDEAEIRGHRRTYVGALPGRIIQGIKNAGSKNPVFMMDEIDKIGADFRGDPSAALLEVLDPAQNHSFSDHYIELSFDLSEVFFITTANILDPIPPALKDRMEVIEFSGYTDEDKFQIVKKFLLPRVIASSGLNPLMIKVSDQAVKKIIESYTKEAGVRNLERKLAEITRKVAFRQASQEEEVEEVLVTDKNIVNYLGPEEFEVAVKEGEDEVGVATGLAWTPAGGEIIFVEAALTPGKGNLTLTGQLGSVMQESARAALTYIRSRSKKLGFDDNFYYKNDIHVHVPEGAVPKDGPSAGIALATSLASMLTKRPVKKEVALSGEVTLSGKVLKVGGIKEKVLAAERGKAKIVILPAANEKNLVDVPQEVKKRLGFKFVNHMDEVLDLALV